METLHTPYRTRPTVGFNMELLHKVKKIDYAALDTVDCKQHSS